MARRRKLKFEVAGRYGYYAVDVYDAKTGGMLDTAISGITRKEAQIIVGAMKDVQGTRYQRLAKASEEIRERQKLKRVV